MEKENKSDLRYRKTEKLICDTFCNMLREMEYAQITIKELTERALINRKTFYLHYSSLDELLWKLQTEIYVQLLEATADLKLPQDMEKLVREMYRFNTHADSVREKILYSQGNFPPGKSPADYVSRKLFHRMPLEEVFQSLPPLESHLMEAYLNGSFTFIYYQWLADGKKLPLEKVIQLTTKLVSQGINIFATREGQEAEEKDAYEK